MTDSSGREVDCGRLRRHYEQPTLTIRKCGEQGLSRPFLWSSFQKPASATITAMAYNHTQPGRWQYVLFAVALAIWPVPGLPAACRRSLTGIFPRRKLKKYQNFAAVGGLPICTLSAVKTVLPESVGRQT